MKGGGTIEGELWTVRVKTLRSLDHIHCLNWSGEESGLWIGGETLVVIWAEPSDKHKGYWSVRIYPLDCPTEGRELLMAPDDKVHMIARDVPMDGTTRIPSQAKTKKRPKKGQMSLF